MLFRSMCLTIDFHPFRKVVEPLGGWSQAKEESHWDQALLDSLSSFLVYSLLWRLDDIYSFIPLFIHDSMLCSEMCAFIFNVFSSSLH